MRSQPEFRLACVVSDYLRFAAPGLLISHFPAGELRTEKTGGRLKRVGLKPGWPDYIGVLSDGRAFGIELKAEGGRMSESQQAVRSAFAARNAPYFVVRSLDDLIETLDELGVAHARAA